MPATRCSEGYSAGTWGADPLDRPPVKIDPPTTRKWYPMTLTARRSHRRKPREVHRNLPQTPTLIQTADAPSSSSNARVRGGAHRCLNNTIRDIDSRRKSLQRATKSGDILYVTNVFTGVVHLAITAPTEADSSRSMDFNKRQLQTASRCRLKLPATCCMVQRQPPLVLCQTRACQAAIPTEQDPLKPTGNPDDSDRGESLL